MQNLTIDEFNKAKEGSLFIKKGDKLVAISKEELFKELKPLKEDIRKVKDDQKSINEMNKFFDLYSKPHFQVVFNAFKIEILGGQIEASDDYLLRLDEYVSEGIIDVKSALKKHPFLEDRFNKLFVDNKKELKGFWEV